MNIVILCLLSLLITGIAWLFLARWQGTRMHMEADALESEATLEADEAKQNNAVSWRLDKRRIVFLAVMAVVLCAMAVALEQIYNRNTLLDNSKLLVLLGILFVAANTDARCRLIPNALVVFGLVARVLFWSLELIFETDSFWSILANDLTACLLVVLFLVVGVFLVKGGLGMGDIKLMLVMCLFQGFYGVVSSLFSSLFIVFIYAIVALLFRKKEKKDSVAFAPAILLGTLISVFLTGM